MDSRKQDLCNYRLAQALETLQVAKECLENKHFKDSINRSYYSAFYAIKAILALEGADFKRHKDVIAYFNAHYVATGIFDRKVGRYLGRLQQKREKSDYDDFYVASQEEAEEQIQAVEEILEVVSVKISYKPK
jgi:uncharacterized protein (UPF0332 family)